MIKLKSIDGKGEVEGRRIFDSNGKPTAYIVTEDGQLWSDESHGYRALDKPTDNGYIMVSMNVDGEWKKQSLHKLVADAFLSNEYNYPCVNHKDCDTTNNNWRNLEHCTFEYNTHYAMVYGNSRYEIPKTHRKLDEDTVRGICEMIQSGYRNIEIAETYGLSKHDITNIKRRQCHTAISKDYDFGDDFVYRMDDLSGNGGNHYIPPLEVEPEYITHDDPRFIEQLCQELSGPEYVNTGYLASLYKVDTRLVRQLRKGEIYPEIVSKYNINNDKSTKPRVRWINNPEKVEEILKLLSSGEHTIKSASTAAKVSEHVIKSVMNDPDYDSLYHDLKEKYPIRLKENHKGYKLTDDQIRIIAKYIRAGELSAPKIAEICNVSKESVKKIRKLMKEGIINP